MPRRQILTIYPLAVIDISFISYDQAPAKAFIVTG